MVMMTIYFSLKRSRISKHESLSSLLILATERAALESEK
jgi:hypothetical protein